MKSLKLLSLLSLVIMAPSLKAELKLKPFETDGCTMFADGTYSKPGLWKHCCTEHDLRYWFGGSENDMDQADLRLRSCVEKAAGPKWGYVIYTGVRAGHHSPIKNKYQWNWGWEVAREKKPLTPAEVGYVITELRSMSVEDVNIDNFIKVNFP
nr:FAD-binding oxidoreductase [Bacteriovorax sp. HI3]